MDELILVGARVAIVGVALTGGALAAFSSFIMPALARLADAEGIRAMQAINRTVFTPWFMVPFFGTTLLCVGAIIVGLLHWDRAWSVDLTSGGALFLLGVFAVTAAGNVPLNERLDDMQADDVAAAAFWRHYLVAWVRWNHVRSVASVLAIVQFAGVVTQT